MKTLCLVSCAAKKLTGRHRAQDIYVSDLFRKSRRFAELNGDNWYILSAKYGLLSPATLIEKYDATLNTMRAKARREWAERVFQQLKSVVSPGDRVVLLAGRHYSEFLVPKLQACGADVSMPLERLRFGPRLSWLKEHIHE